MKKETGKTILIISSVTTLIFSILVSTSAILRNNFTDLILTFMLCLFSMKVLVEAQTN